MKRVDQIFELPVDEMDVLQAIDNFSEEKDEAIVRAINHIDALADALDDLLCDIENGGASRYNYEIALQALAAYRGDK